MVAAYYTAFPTLLNTNFKKTPLHYFQLVISGQILYTFAVSEKHFPLGLCLIVVIINNLPFVVRKIVNAANAIRAFGTHLSIQLIECNMFVYHNNRYQSLSEMSFFADMHRYLEQISYK